MFQSLSGGQFSDAEMGKDFLGFLGSRVFPVDQRRESRLRRFAVSAGEWFSVSGFATAPLTLRLSFACEKDGYACPTMCI